MPSKGRSMKMPGNPLKSEAAAFAWLLLVGGVVLAIGLLAVLIDALA